MLDKFAQLEPSKKRMVVIIITVTCFLILICIIAALKMNTNPPKTSNEKVQIKTDYGRADSLLAERFAKDEEIEQLQSENKKLKEQINSSKNNPIATKNLENQDNIIKSYPQPTSIDEMYPPLPPRPEKDYSENIPTKKVYGIASFEIEKNTPKQNKESVIKTNFIPATTLLRTVILTGVYAPTRASGKSSPYPVVMRIYDDALFPNNMTQDLKGCQFLGEAHGELQESRAHIRVTKIVCVSRDGRRVLEKDIEGWVMGEDGKVGVPGVIEDNFGMLLSKTFLAQTVAGLGEAIESSKKVVKTDAIGGIHQYTEDDVKSITSQAVGKGLGESFKMIADFLMDLLRDQSPVVRVNAMREVDIFIRSGIELITDEMQWTGVVDSKGFTDTDTILMELKGIK